MLSILCNLNLGEDDTLRQSYPNLADANHTKNVQDNKVLYNKFIAEAIRIFVDVTEPSSRRVEQLKKIVLDVDNRLDCVSLAISCLQLFAQVNWLGPVPVDLLNLPSLIQRQHKPESLENFVFNLTDYFPLRSKVYLLDREV